MPGVISTMPKAEHLRDVRRSRYLSQRMLAERAGVSRATIARLERGEEAHFETLWKLAEALGVEPGKLAGES